MVTNDAARLAHAPDWISRSALLEAGFPLKRLFSPEHGIAARAPDGTEVKDQIDPVTGLPVISLYGSVFSPAASDLAGLDAILFDIPDVGARFYTYIWTLYHLIEACAENGRPIFILDRPNPIGGQLEDAEGPLLESDCASFLGQAAIPIRHSLTVGELGLHWQRTLFPHAEVHVIPVANWARAAHWPATGVPWVPPSPALRSYEAALLYSGLCFFEGTNLSIGRGTATPFQVLGAPWFSFDRVAAQWSAISQGVQIEPTAFTPDEALYQGARCEGIRFSVTEARVLRPVSFGLRLLDLIRREFSEFAWRPYPTAANPSGEGHFDRLAGTRRIRMAMETGIGFAADWTACPDWAETVGDHLLYPEVVT
jgi:uncharacterized protein YbbC (DUF1343 family)